MQTPVVEHSIPGLNSAEEVFRGVVFELGAKFGVLGEVHGQAIIVRVGSLAVGCGPFDGTWGVLAYDSSGVPVAIRDDAFIAFSDQEFRFCSHQRIADALMSSIRSLRSNRPDDYLVFLISGVLASAGGYWSLGRERLTLPETLNLSAIDQLVAVASEFVSSRREHEVISAEDFSWLRKSVANVKLWRKLSGVREVLDFVTGLNDILRAGGAGRSHDELRELVSCMKKVTEG